METVAFRARAAPQQICTDGEQVILKMNWQSRGRRKSDDKRAEVTGKPGDGGNNDGRDETRRDCTGIVRERINEKGERESEGKVTTAKKPNLR
jgi:hypothetical protein